jgi:hypothetical protein
VDDVSIGHNEILSLTPEGIKPLLLIGDTVVLTLGDEEWDVQL